MISIEVKGKRFDLSENARFSFKAENPFLALGYIPGPVVYQVEGIISNQNRLITEFADQISNTSRKIKIEDVLIYIGGIVWRKGVMRLKKAGSAGYQFSFFSDAGDAKSKIENLRLSDLPLETGVTVDDQSDDYYPTAKHVFFPVYNPDFYGSKNEDYAGYQNYYSGGSFGTNGGSNKYTKTPFIYALYVLEECLKLMGYPQISGDILTNEDAQRMVVFNTNSLDELDGNGLNVMKTTFNYAEHLPDIPISDYVIDTCLMLGVVPIFDAKAKSVELISFQEYFTDKTSLDFNAKTSEENEITPNEFDGVQFIMKADSRDKALEQNSDWLELKSGNGKEEFVINASSLQVEQIEDVELPGRTWTIPQVNLAGNSPAFEQINRNRSLRFLYFKGNPLDSQDNSYPQGHWEGVNCDLRWEGFNGLVAQRFQKWLDFKANTELVSFEADIELMDLLNFSFKNKLMAYYLRFIVGDYSAQVEANGISPMQLNAWRWI